MLKKLNISNLAIIDNLSIEFDSSFNVVTGESGSGKTILYKAINYLLGEKFRKADLRYAEDKCMVEGIIEIDNTKHSISRIFTKGTAKCFIDNKPTSKKEYIAFLKNSWESYGQHEKQHLVKEDSHIKYLDYFAGNVERLDRYQSLFNDYNALILEVNIMKEKVDDYNNNKELYDFQLNEINQIDIFSGQDIEISNTITNLKEIKEISDVLNKVINLNSSNSRLIESIENASRLLSKLDEKSEKVIETIDRLENLITEISDTQYELAKNSRDFYYSENDYNELHKQLVSINELKRKYGGTIESVLRYKQDLLSMIDNANNFEELIIKKKDKINFLEKKINDLSRKLFKTRQAEALKLEKKVRKDLARMDMEDVEFVVELGVPTLNDVAIDKCMIAIRTNKGESINTIGKIASGGELSRIMLAIKLSINSNSKGKIYILDEIDSGLSGKEANSIGLIIQDLSRSNQVICITHLSQIASKADRHLKISKFENNNRTSCKIENLDVNSKINELAILISGKEVTSQSIDYAKKMLGA